MASYVAKPKEDESGARYLRLHPAWFSFIRYCEEIGFGEIDRLKIQDGLPMIAEEVRKKVGFAKGPDHDGRPGNQRDHTSSPSIQRKALSAAGPARRVQNVKRIQFLECGSKNRTIDEK